MRHTLVLATCFVLVTVVLAGCDKIEESGSIHMEMFDHIARDDIAVVDITTLNPNVFYELGVRHAQRPNTTLIMIEDQAFAKLPFETAGAFIRQVIP